MVSTFNSYKYAPPSADCDLELKLYVEYEYEQYRPAVINRLPEDCYPAEGGDLTIIAVWLYAPAIDGQPPAKRKRVDILELLSKDDLEQLESQVMTEIENKADQPDYDEGDRECDRA